ncbi:hypothetical protein SAMN04487950_2845 [Halogranum rubrum]|uniref:Uncharacterized protein n=1 Tax=Halogranum rubrum TaxID=553466 RepID=A0A1I4FX12_9EURY|nr:hypothetical protein [Halogranum rubrum]SFL21527.1 hypothetical protein SAMN04487950_2845 [Halogranum rubrum]
MNPTDLTIEIVDATTVVGIQPDDPNEPFQIDYSVRIPNNLFAIECRVIRQSSAEAPPAIEIGLRNVADESLAVWFGITPPFDGFPDMETGGQSLWLIPEKDEKAYIEPNALIPTQPQEGLWRLIRRFDIPQPATVIEMDPDEVVRRTYSMLFPPGSESEGQAATSDLTKVSGIYTFEDQHRVKAQPGKGGESSLWVKTTVSVRIKRE